MGSCKMKGGTVGAPLYNPETNTTTRMPKRKRSGLATTRKIKGNRRLARALFAKGKEKMKRIRRGQSIVGRFYGLTRNQRRNARRREALA